MALDDSLGSGRLGGHAGPQAPLYAPLSRSTGQRWQLVRMAFDYESAEDASHLCQAQNEQGMETSLGCGRVCAYQGPPF